MKSLFNFNLFINRVKFISNSKAILNQLTFASCKSSTSNCVDSCKSGDININNKLSIIFGCDVFNLLKMINMNNDCKY